MKKLLSLLVCCVWSLSVYPQISNVEVTIGEIASKGLKDAFIDVEPIGSDEAFAYYILHPYKKYVANTLSTKATRLARLNKETLLFDLVEDFEIKKGSDDLEYAFHLSLGDDIYQFSSFQDKSEKKAVLYNQVLNKKELKPFEAVKEVISIDYADIKNYKNTEFNYELSPDKSKVLITFHLLDKKDNLLKMGMSVLDNKLNVLYTLVNPEFPSEGIYSFSRFRVDNQGRVYLLSAYFKDRKEEKDNVEFKKKWILSDTRDLVTEANYDYRLLAFQKNGKSSEYTLHFDDRFITYLDFTFDKDQNPVCAGFTSDPGKTSVSGSCLVTIDVKQKKIINQNQKDFDKEFILNGMSEKEVKKAEQLLDSKENFENYRYAIRDLHVKKDGGYYLIAEKYHKQTVDIRSGNSVSTVYEYNYKDIIVLHFNPTGKVLWERKINKKQDDFRHLGFFFLSYGHSIVNDEVYVTYTDLDKKSLNLVQKFKNTATKLVKIDSNGAVTADTIFNSEDNELTIRAWDTWVDDKGNMILHAQKNDTKYGFVKLDIK